MKSNKVEWHYIRYEKACWEQGFSDEVKKCLRSWDIIYWAKQMRERLAIGKISGERPAQSAEKRQRPSIGDIGEAIACCVLAKQFGVYMPWPAAYDKKVITASLPGADIVGLRRVDNKGIFVFGECKCTSKSNQRPKIGRALEEQVRNLVMEERQRDRLISWMLPRIGNPFIEAESEFHKIMGYADGNAYYCDLFLSATEEYAQNNRWQTIGIIVKTGQQETIFEWRPWLPSGHEGLELNLIEVHVNCDLNVLLNEVELYARENVA